MAKGHRKGDSSGWPADPARIEADLRQCIKAIRDQNSGAAVPDDVWRRVSHWFDGECGRLFRGRLVDGEDADDLRQRVFVRLFEGNFSSFDEAKRATSFVRTSCHRMAVNQYRKATRRKTGPLGDFVPTDAGPLPEEVLAEQQSRGAVQKHADALGEKLRTVVQSRFWEGLTLAAIARHCKCATSTVHARLAKASDLLHELLADEGYSQ